LDNSVLYDYSLCIIHSTLIGRFHTPNKTDVNLSYLVPITFRILKTGNNNQPRATIVILLDSGASSTLIRENCAKNLRSIESAPANWITTAGTFKTTEQTQYQRILPDLHEGRTQYVVINMLLLGVYDIIFGRDLLMNW
jgi:Retroviral aspartyl protease